MSARVIELRLPSDDQASIVIRMTTAGALARMGFGLDIMEDVKLAAEEACKCLVRSSGCGGLFIRYTLRDDGFTLDALADKLCGCECEGVTDEEVGIIRCVLLSMMDTVELEFDDNCLRGIHMSKSLQGVLSDGRV